MSNFIQNLLSRHTTPVNQVIPRLPGRFESIDQSTHPGSGELNSAREKDAAAFSVDSKTQVASEQDIAFVRKENPTAPLITENDFHPLNPPPIVNFIDNAEKISGINYEADRIEEGKQTKISGDYENRNDKITGEGYGFSGKTIKENIFTNNQFNLFDGRLTGEKQVVVGKQKEVQNDIIIQGLPASENYLKPVSGNKKIQDAFVKPAGIFGEPPGVNTVYSQKIKDQIQTEQSGKPIIKVSIGQINVRAVSQPAVAAKKSIPVTKTGLSLEDYLKKRNKDQ